MGKRIHKDDEIRRRFIQIDRILLENPKYERLSDGAILAYAILRDRLNLSKENADVYTDDAGFLYVIYTDEELGYLLHRTRQTANARKKELEKFGLLEMVRGGYQEPNRIYICEPDVCEPSEYISNRYKEKLEEKYLAAEKRKIDRYKQKYIMIELPENADGSYPQQDKTLGGQQMSKILTSNESKKRTTSSQKNRQLDVKKTDIINTKYNKNKDIENEIYILFDDDKKASNNFEINLYGLQKLKDLLETDNPEFIKSIVKKMKEIKIPFFYEWEIRQQLAIMANYEKEFEPIINRGSFFVQGIANMRHSTEHSKSKQQVNEYIKKQILEKEKQKKFAEENKLTVPFYNWLES